MKKFLVVALLLGGVAWATGVYKVGREIQLLNRSVPASDLPVAGEYINLSNVKKIRLTICTCTSSACTTRGGNLTGGTMQCWYKPPSSTINEWSINTDLALSVGSTGTPCRTWLDMESPGGNTGGAMFCQASSVTAASGTHLDVFLEGISND